MLKTWQGKRKKLLIIGLTGASLMVSSLPSYALFGMGDIVFDPSNFVENSMTAAKSAANYVVQLDDKINMINRLINQTENLATLPGQEVSKLLAPVQSLMQTKQMLMQEVAQVQNLGNTLAGAGGNIQDYYKSYLASNLTPQGFYSTQLQMANNGNTLGIDELNSVQQNLPVMKQEMSNIISLNNQIQATSGVHGDEDAQLQVLESEMLQENRSANMLNQEISEMEQVQANQAVARAAERKNRINYGTTIAASMEANAESLAKSGEGMEKNSGIASQLQQYVPQNNSDKQTQQNAFAGE